MELIFNELSVRIFADSQFDAHERMTNLLRTLKESKKYDFNKFQVERDFYNYQLFKDYKVIDWLNSDKTSHTEKNLFFAMVKYQFEVIAEKETEYMETIYYLKNEDTEVTGLSIAYLNNTLAISLLSEELWRNTEIILVIKAPPSEVEVKNIGAPEHLKIHSEWLASIRPPNLIQSVIIPGDKKIKIGEHHGKEILESFSRKIINSPYVNEIINSLSFTGKGSKFIKSVKSSGIIEIVLTKTDRKIGIVVQTTGRNYYETKRISEILKVEYDNT